SNPRMTEANKQRELQIEDNNKKEAFEEEKSEFTAAERVKAIRAEEKETLANLKTDWDPRLKADTTRVNELTEKVQAAQAAKDSAAPVVAEPFAKRTLVYNHSTRKCEVLSDNQLGGKEFKEAEGFETIECHSQDELENALKNTLLSEMLAGEAQTNLAINIASNIASEGDDTYLNVGSQCYEA